MWSRRVLKAVCNYLDLSYYKTVKRDSLPAELPQLIKDRTYNEIDYSPADYRIVSKLSKFRGATTIRDLRDMIVSGYFSHRYSHSPIHWPELVALRERLEKVSIEKGLLLEMKFVDKMTIKRIANWNFDDNRILVMRFEDFVNDEFDAFLRVYSFLNLIGNEKGYMTEDVLAKILRENSWDKLTQGRKIGKEDRKNHYRKGIVGDWKTYFTDGTKRYFKKHYGKLLISLGYESDLNW